MTIAAWYMDDNSPVSQETLDSLGVFQRQIDAENYEQELSALCEERGYAHRSIVNICKEYMPDLDQKLRMFFEEHLHEYEEIRFFMEGSGYFDVRDQGDRWIRLHPKKGDLIVLPAGIYHRFTLDDSMYAKAMRLFVKEQKEPVWTPFNRSEKETDEMPARAQYVKHFLNNQ